MAVDLVPLRPGGENGGLKPTVVALLREARRQCGGQLSYLFLTNSLSHPDVRSFAAAGDIIACVSADSALPIDELQLAPGEFRLTAPPPDLLATLGADLLYCPFGATDRHTAGVPTIALVADVLHREFPGSVPDEERAHRERYIRHTLDVATKIQCISRSGLEQLRRYYDPRPEKLFWTYPSIQERLDSIGGDASNRPQSEEHFFYPANLWPHKNHEVLLRAYSRYVAAAGDAAWKLVLTFAPSARLADLQVLADECGIASKVEFAGFVADARLRELWRGAGALVFPSLHEGFGIPVLEAMHYGVPVIANRAPALTEVAGDAACFVDARDVGELANAMIVMAEDRMLRERLRLRGRQRLTLFSLTAASRSLLDAFEEATGCAGHFPRKPRRVLRSSTITAPTPASEKRWRISIVVEAGQTGARVNAYLAGLLFASHELALGRNDVYFFCRPNGRVLTVECDWDNPAEESESEATIETIQATDEEGQQLTLFSGSSIATDEA